MSKLDLAWECGKYGIAANQFIKKDVWLTNMPYMELTEVLLQSQYKVKNVG